MNNKIEPFEKYTERYEEWFDRNEYAYKSELKAVKELLPDFDNGIEIGVGSGRFSGPLGVKTGIDPSSKMLKIAEERDIEVIKGLGEYLPFRDKSFDFALVVTTICFFADVKKSLKKIYDILKRDGHIVIGFVDRESKLGRLYQKKKDKNVFYKDATFYSSKEVISLLNELGFTQIKTKQTLFEDLDCLDKTDDVREGHDEASFVVVKAKKIV